MAFFGFLNHWWNLPFLVMLGLVVVFFVLQVVGLLGHHGDGDVHHEHEHEHEHEHDAEGDGHGMLSWLGVGRVPFMVVWVTGFIFGGFTGLIVNRLFFLNGPYPTWAFAVALAAALVVGIIGVRLFSRLAAKLVDTGGRGATAKHELAGKQGVVASAHLDGEFGEVRVHDAGGNELLIHARLGPGEPALARGAKVVLVEFDTEKELFWATASPAEAQERS